MKEERRNKPVEKTSQGNRELLIVLEILFGYVKQKEKIHICISLYRYHQHLHI